MANDCGCPTHRGRSITDPEKHRAWHAQVLAQLGTPYVGDPGIVRAVRGTGAWTELGETLIDRRKRNGGRRT